jgi:hypothetical protein
MEKFIKYTAATWDHDISRNLPITVYLHKEGTGIRTLIAIHPEDVLGLFITQDPDISNKYFGSSQIYLPNPDYVDNTGLIDALKMSIKQWEIMVISGKGKTTSAKFINGNVSPYNNCFLCNYVKHMGGSTEGKNCRKYCINWNPSTRIGNKNIECTSGANAGRTTYQAWSIRSDQEATEAVVVHLKKALNKLLEGSK